MTLSLQRIASWCWKKWALSVRLQLTAMYRSPRPNHLCADAVSNQQMELRKGIRESLLKNVKE